MKKQNKRERKGEKEYRRVEPLMDPLSDSNPNIDHIATQYHRLTLLFNCHLNLFATHSLIGVARQDLENNAEDDSAAAKKSKSEKFPLNSCEFATAVAVFFLFTTGLFCIYLTASEFGRIKLPRTLSDLLLLKEKTRTRATLDDTEIGQLSSTPLLVEDDKPSKEVEESVKVLKDAAKTRKVAAEKVLSALSIIEKAKIDPSGFLETLGGNESPGRT
ncbi:hypothetical protein AHAS_Ahas01G0237900 [Arachis hypogaea]